MTTVVGGPRSTPAAGGRGVGGRPDEGEIGLGAGADARARVVRQVKLDAREAARDLHRAVVAVDAATTDASPSCAGEAAGVDGDDESHVTTMTRNVGRAAGRGLRWSLVGAVSTRFGGLLLGVVLARILTPEDYGLYAIALGAMNFVMHVNDVGLIAATVQWRGRLEEMAATATTLALVSSAAIYGLFWVLAPSFSSLAGSPEAAPVVRLLTVVILIDGVTAVRVGSLLRTFRQDRITIANFLGLLCNAAVAIALALHGAGAMSFAAGQVAGAAITGAFVLWSVRMPWKLGFDRMVARRLMRFGLPLAMGLGVEAVLLNVDYILVGRIMGATALGFYLLAFNVANWAPGVIGTALRWVSVPSFSRLSEEDGALSPAVQRSVALLVTCVLPIGFLFALLAPAVVDVLYGAEWAPAVPALRFLIVLGLVRMLTQFAVDILVGAGATRSAFWLNLAWAVTLVPALVVGTRIDGIRGAAIAHALVAGLVALPLALSFLRRAGVQLAPIAGMLVRPLIAAAAGAVICAVAAQMTASSAILQLLVAGTAGLGTYALIAVPPEQRRRWLQRSSAPEHLATGVGR
jgi:PST family polysaccharide transporter